MPSPFLHTFFLTTFEAAGERRHASDIDLGQHTFSNRTGFTGFLYFLNFLRPITRLPNQQAFFTTKNPVHPENPVNPVLLAEVRQELLAVGLAHAGDQIRPAVFDPLVLGLQQLNGLGLDTEEVVREIGCQALEHIAADGVLCGHGRKTSTAPRRFKKRVSDGRIKPMLSVFRYWEKITRSPGSASRRIRQAGPSVP
ncbi:hypothetical protein, partial [Herbaspirillum sp.]|uniref:hypothetical protein n=1 Tax=Herbaspirillum sp. TaxID=1890675 RepID=UPI00258B855B